MIFVLVACAPNEPPDSCRPFVISDEFVLAADRIVLGSIEQRADPASCAQFEGMRACSYSDGRLIRVYLRNETPTALQIDWSTARYSDESGRMHELILFPDPLPNLETIPSGQGRWQTVVPEEKRSINVTDGMRHQVIDQFLPFDDRCTQREHLLALVERDIAPVISLSITVNGEQSPLTIGFRLEQTDIATFQIRRAQASRELEKS